MIEWQHIYPTDDIIKHKTDSDGYDEFVCQCNPKIEIDNHLIIHFAMDGRKQE